MTDASWDGMAVQDGKVDDPRLPALGKVVWNGFVPGEGKLPCFLEQDASGNYSWAEEAEDVEDTRGACGNGSLGYSWSGWGRFGNGNMERRSGELVRHLRNTIPA